MDAFKTGGFAGVGAEIGARLGYGSKIATLEQDQKIQLLTAIDNLKGQTSTSTGFNFSGFDKFLIAGVVAVLGAIVVSRAMK